MSTTPEPTEADIKLADTLFDEALSYTGRLPEYRECVKWLVRAHVASETAPLNAEIAALRQAVDDIRVQFESASRNMNEARRERDALRTVLVELSETAVARGGSSTANTAYLAALNKARALLQP